MARTDLLKRTRDTLAYRHGDDELTCLRSAIEYLLEHAEKLEQYNAALLAYKATCAEIDMLQHGHLTWNSTHIKELGSNHYQIAKLMAARDTYHKLIQENS